MMKKRICFMIMCLVLMLSGVVSVAAKETAVKSYTLCVGEKKTLNLSVKGKKKWSSTDKKIATVSSKGKVTAKAPGSVKIKAKVNGRTYVYTVTVKQPVEKIKLTYHSELVLGINFEGGKCSMQLAPDITPKNASNKKVKWKSSNPAVAVVNQTGCVETRGNGTCKITCSATDGSNVSTTIKVTVTNFEGIYDTKGPEKIPDPKPGKGKFLDCSKGYELINEFRQTKGVWYWCNDNKNKVVFNKTKEMTLQPLKRSEVLERVAKIRAKELSESFSHYRPNGQSCFQAYPSNLWAVGENIAMGQGTIVNAFTDWREVNKYYSGQGHRRNMLSQMFNSVGIAGYTLNGTRYWVQCFGYIPE